MFQLSYEKKSRQDKDIIEQGLFHRSESRYNPTKDKIDLKYQSEAMWSKGKQPANNN